MKACPIGPGQVDENVVRLNALGTLVLVAISMATASPVPVLFLAIDLSLRILLRGRYSPLVRVNRLLARRLRLEPVLVNAAPKILAAKIGFAAALAMVLLIHQGVHGAGIAVGSALVLFTFLESAFGICVACLIYPLLPIRPRAEGR